MSSFVLVAGAWLGGWVWHDVANELRGSGHDVYPATLTGLGERRHLGGPSVDLDTHITDVVNLVTHEGLHDVILVGHSYSGIVVTGVADRIPERLSHLVYVDSAPFHDGESMLDISPPADRETLRRAVETTGDGWRMEFPGFDELGKSASLAGLGERERRLLAGRAAPHPFGTYTQPLGVRAAGPPPYRRVAIACDDLRALVATGLPRFQTMTSPPWLYRELATGHWPMLSTPRQLAGLLDSLVSAEPAGESRSGSVPGKSPARLGSSGPAAG